MLRLADYEKFASDVLAKDVFNIYHYAAEDRMTFDDNIRAIKRFVFAILYQFYSLIQNNPNSSYKI